MTYGKSRYARRKPTVPEWIDYGEDVEVVPERLLRARLEAAKSQETLGDEIRVSHVYLSECERRGRIGETALAAVAESTGKPLSYFSQPWPSGVPVEYLHLDRWCTLVRERNGCGVTEWARWSGFDRRNWQRWEAGEKVPCLSSLARIREVDPAAPWPPDGPK